MKFFVFRDPAISGFQWTDAGDHDVPCLKGLGNGNRFVLASRRNRRTDLPAYGADHAVDDFITSIRGAAGLAVYIGFCATGAMSFSHNSGGECRVGCIVV